MGSTPSCQVHLLFLSGAFHSTGSPQISNTLASSSGDVQVFPDPGRGLSLKGQVLLLDVVVDRVSGDMIEFL